MSCPQIWNIEKEKDREKEKVGRRTGSSRKEKERQRARARDKKQRSHFLLEEQHEHCSGGEIMRTVSGHQGENERQ